jgi:hypothetical protein
MADLRHLDGEDELAFDVEYLKGSDHANAVALSRNPRPGTDLVPDEATEDILEGEPLPVRNTFYVGRDVFRTQVGHHVPMVNAGRKRARTDRQYIAPRQPGDSAASSSPETAASGSAVPQAQR